MTKLETAERVSPEMTKFSELGFRMAIDANLFERFHILSEPEQQAFAQRFQLAFLAMLIGNSPDLFSSEVKKLWEGYKVQKQTKPFTAISDENPYAHSLKLADKTALALHHSLIIPHYIITNMNTYVFGHREDVSMPIEGRSILDGYNTINLKKELAMFS